MTLYKCSKQRSDEDRTTGYQGGSNGARIVQDNRNVLDPTWLRMLGVWPLCLNSEAIRAAVRCFPICLFIRWGYLFWKIQTCAATPFCANTPRDYIDLWLERIDELLLITVCALRPRDKFLCIMNHVPSASEKWPPIVADSKKCTLHCLAGLVLPSCRHALMKGKARLMFAILELSRLLHQIFVK
jgi:hypothetical protein